VLAFTLIDVAAATGGSLEGEGGARVLSVVTDTRQGCAGVLFVALRGEHSDGHRYAEDALRAGAVGVLVGSEYSGTGPLVRVPDPLTALAALAAAARARLRAKVIAVTGSSGKTTTKDFIAAACGVERRTVASRASYNNEIGVPLTVLSADEDTEVLVVEVGSRGLGHIASLAPVVGPDVAVVTNVGSAHIGMFGSIEVTARAKSELVHALGGGGVAVLNQDDANVLEMAAGTGAAVVTFGRSPAADVRAQNVTLDERACASFSIVAGTEQTDVVLRVPGEHMVINAVAAAAAARAVGITLHSAAAGIGGIESAQWRMQISDKGGRRIINDAYNANPDSTVAALKTLVSMGRGRPTWAVLGHMAELGARSTVEHDLIGRLVVRLGIHRLVTVGADARPIHEAARLEGLQPEEATFVPDADAAIRLLRDSLEADAVVLVKASRAAGLERVAAALGDAE